MLTETQIERAARRARAIVSTVLVEHRGAHTIGWTTAFVRGGRLHIIQRAHVGMP